MEYRILNNLSDEELSSLFTSVFSSSEGEQEGRLIGGLASQLAARVDDQEVICLGAYQDGSIIGAIFFTRLRFDEPVDTYMLSPVAVSTAHQGSRVGQALINFGLQELKRRSVSVVVTYGDPLYYSKVGFHALSEDVIQAPLDLSMPEGWLGQSLSGEAIPELKGRPVCVSEFDNPDYW
ncbi:acetyltransferase [Luminiphilus syltensis NOR5-1B]|uniref:Acetyltransferase n=1 Tax=Luminiphilus syltensis NOR5-1B TaxID=565045 RepID=B8KSH5_9GAMM|nr:N-acetyltransferase [Luminiphilus syltensis]EED36613.1 acetyltransferase [Luminiphilus syltensis NOR5-1B]